MPPVKTAAPEATILVVDDEVLVRSAIAEYLRDCGYRVIEGANAAEAVAVLQNKELRVAIVLSAFDIGGAMDGFALSRWAREHRPDIEMILAGTPEREASAAALLCDRGPMLARPYDPQLVHDRIKRMLAGRKLQSEKI
jgi:DNA-binding NtrC family response regulator